MEQGNIVQLTWFTSSHEDSNKKTCISQTNILSRYFIFIFIL